MTYQVLNEFKQPNEQGDNELHIGGTMTILPTANISRTGRQVVIPICGNSKVGATAGWVITGASDISQATLPASNTTSTLVVPITGLKIGDTLTGVSVSGQISSSGGNGELLLSARKVTAQAAGNVDEELGLDDIGVIVTDTLIDSNNLAVTGLSETLVEGQSFYALLTGTTAAAVSIDLASIIATFTES